jgi:hypothetical protein
MVIEGREQPLAVYNISLEEVAQSETMANMKKVKRLAEQSAARKKTTEERTLTKPAFLDPGGNHTRAKV